MRLTRRTNRPGALDPKLAKMERALSDARTISATWDFEFTACKVPVKFAVLFMENGSIEVFRGTRRIPPELAARAHRIVIEQGPAGLIVLLETD
jgi:hypothetical protein